MAKQTKSLFAQIRDEDAQRRAPSTPWNSPVVRWSFVAVAVVVMTLAFPRSGLETQSGRYDVSLLGTTWTQDDVVADYTFPVMKDPVELQREQDSARRSSPPICRVAVVASAPSRLEQASEMVSTDGKQWLRLHWAELVEMFAQRYILDRSVDSLQAAAVVIQRTDATDVVVDVAQLTDVQRLKKLIGQQTSTASPAVRDELRTVLLPLVQPSITVEPSATAQAQRAAAQAVPSTIEIVRQNDVLVVKGQRLDEATLRRLASYRYAQYLRSDSPVSLFMVLGSLGHAALIAAFVVLYLIILRPTSFERIGQLGSLLALPVLTALLAWISARLESVVPYEYVIVVPALSMIITILYEARTALVLTMAMALAVGVARGNDFGIVLVLLSGGVLAIYSTQHVRNRTQIFTSIFAIFIGLVIATLAVELERATPVEAMWPKLLMATANAVLSPLITFAVIIVFERMFNVATDMRLEEFDNLNHPLLQKLNEQAPGTYQHTMAVARLAEAAASAIGANTLLTRVGAYFHDIGKLEKSEYFVENQMNIGNKHDRLPPKKSAAIIRQHVQDGIELAREYRLPERIWSFIPMHHGTMLIKHFYTLAIEESQAQGAHVDESDFRYPGPLPNSKETAIVMMADAVEALSRLEDTSSRKTLSEAVETIMIDRMMDGQLRDVPLTLHDLDVIRSSFVKSLLGMSHKRVRYATSAETPESSADAAS
ncbi:MAG: HD family phosphohydrolase [Candidatus Kapaibacteriota bacterium]